MTERPVLLPQPRTLALGEETCAVERRVHSVDESLPAQGYRLETRSNGVASIVSADAAGRFYAEQTLLQLERLDGGTVPVGVIEDWPDLAQRGVMIDVSRDKVPKMGTLFALVNRLAEWKINQLQLYTEHTFAYEAHEDVWRGASPLTAEHVRALQNHCLSRHVELVPNQNCLGHMERWLRHDRYRALARKPGGFDFLGDHRGPSTLDPSNPDSMALVRSLLAELLPNFRSRHVNVGLDEPWELKGETEEYLGWVRALRAAPELDGREMLMWGDIVAGRPELVDALPDGVTVCEWGYEAEHPFGDRARVFSDAGRPFWVCPGTSSWVSLVGRWSNARANIGAAVEAAIHHGGSGMLITDWGDLGHLQHEPVSLPGFAYGAAASWCLETNRGLDVARALDTHAFLDEAGVLGSLLLDAGDAHRLLSTQIPNVSLLAAPLYLPRFDLARAGITAGEFAAAAAVIDGCRDRLATARPRVDDREAILDEL
ncbi:MAG: family 20 glycosylhydrolase, partial [Actinobacteria bacterium]|nr:family 20 glycosylhydrolase [Actinomycetota bacterium]